MRECSVAVVVVLLVFVNGDQLDDVGQRQSIPMLQKTNRKYEKHDLQDELFGSSEGRSLHGKEEKEVGEQPRLWGLRRMPRSTGDLHGVCNCLGNRSAPPSVCSSDIADFEPIIINETCLNGTQRRRRRRRRRWEPVEVEGNVTFATPSFPDLPLCEGTRTLLLVSSGKQLSLKLSNVPSVWVCPGSLAAHLQELAIINVPEVKIAPKALAHRLTNITLKMTGMSEELVFPRGALSVEVKNVDDASNNLTENITQVKVVVEGGTVVKFERRSVLAPRVWVEVQQMEAVQIETQAFSSSFYSALHVSTTLGLIMETRAAVVNSLQLTNISKTVLTEESVVVMASEGEVILRDMRDVAASEGAITLGGGATLEVSDVSFTNDNNRVLVSRSPLKSVVLRGVEVPGSNSTSICLATHALSLLGVTAESSEHFPASACLRFVRGMINTTDAGGVVLCEVGSVNEITNPSLCADPRCASCRENQTESSMDVEVRWWEEPKYLVPAVALVLLLLVLLLSYCFYRRHKCHKKGTYELPQQTYRIGTFQRTIITPDNLDNFPPGQPPHAPPSNVASAELFVSYCVSHGPSLQQAALFAQQNMEIGRATPVPSTMWRESHHPGTYQQYSSLMTPEDNYSISSSEMTI